MKGDFGEITKIFKKISREYEIQVSEWYKCYTDNKMYISVSRLREDNRRLRDDRRDFEKDIERVKSNIKTEREQLDRDRREVKKLIEGIHSKSNIEIRYAHAL